MNWLDAIPVAIGLLNHKAQTKSRNQVNDAVAGMGNAAQYYNNLYQSVYGGNYDWSNPTRGIIGGGFEPSQDGISPYLQAIHQSAYQMTNPMGSAEEQAALGTYYDQISQGYDTQRKNLIQQAVASGQSPDPTRNPALQNALNNLDMEHNLSMQGAQRDILLQKEDLRRQAIGQTAALSEPIMTLPTQMANIYGQQANAASGVQAGINAEYTGLASSAYDLFNGGNKTSGSSGASSSPYSYYGSGSSYIQGPSSFSLNSRSASRASETAGTNDSLGAGTKLQSQPRYYFGAAFNPTNYSINSAKNTNSYARYPWEF